ncbi:hypothetical protein [Microbispora sp. NPDC049125]|uniref:hypothetical protein n=1 Tax=Microbispora sp. NPDC049125 TaxID=3154929 RepID=UPI003465FBC4
MAARKAKPPYQPGDKVQGLVWDNGTTLATGMVVSCEQQPPFVCNWCRVHVTPPPEGLGGHTDSCDCDCHQLPPQPVEWVVKADMGVDGVKEYRNVNSKGESDYLGRAA